MLYSLFFLFLQKVFILDENNAPLYFPWESFGKLKALKAIDLRANRYMYNTNVTQDICNLNSLTYFGITRHSGIESIPDCIGQMKSLFRLDLEVLSGLTYITPDIWYLPNINHIRLHFTFIDYTSFINFTHWNNNTLKKVTLQGTLFCVGYLLEDETVMDLIDNNPELGQFIEYYDACADPCFSHGDDSYINGNGTFINYFTCILPDWQDGKCDAGCDTSSCFYDGGDCNQLCMCDETLWGDGHCDSACNNTYCDWDFGDCEFGKNETCDIDGLCVSQWSVDTFCDNYCNNEECGYDDDNCRSCGDSYLCSELSFYVIDIVASIEEPYELITKNELCGSTWDIIKIFVGEDNNCTELFFETDLNNNGLIGFYEAMLAFEGYFGFQDYTKWEVKQLPDNLNCSLCLSNQSTYFL